MKTKLYFLSLILAIASCKTNSKKDPVKIDPSDPIIETSLNGPLEPDAKSSITYFIANSGTPHPDIQIWMKEELVEGILNLLEAEIKTGVVHPDGIRIYFTSSSIVSRPTPSSDGIVIVSTYASGTAIEPTGAVNVHTDYFEHSQKEAAKLAAMVSNGDIQITHYEKGNNNGALLYDICNCDISHPCAITSSHDIKRSQAESLAQHFANGASNSRSEWFDIDMIRNLVKEMKDVTEKDDGIRIYFARNTAGAEKDKEEFVIVTTQLVAGVHKDYFDCIQPPHTGDKGNGQDNGELCPDHCDGVTEP